MPTATENTDADFPTDWRTIQEEAVRNDNYRCIECGRDTELYTIYETPVNDGGHTAQNLVTLCRRHAPPSAQTPEHLYVSPSGVQTSQPDASSTPFSLASDTGTANASGVGLDAQSTQTQGHAQGQAQTVDAPDGVDEVVDSTVDVSVDTTYTVAESDLREFWEHLPFIKTLFKEAVLGLGVGLLIVLFGKIGIPAPKIFTSMWGSISTVLAAGVGVGSTAYYLRIDMVLVSVLYGVHLLHRDYMTTYYPATRSPTSISRGTTGSQMLIAGVGLGVTGAIRLAGAFTHSVSSPIVTGGAGIAYLAFGVLGMVSLGDAVVSDLKEGMSVRAFAWDWGGRVGAVLGVFGIQMAVGSIGATVLTMLPVVAVLGYVVRRRYIGSTADSGSVSDVSMPSESVSMRARLRLVMAQAGGMVAYVWSGDWLPDLNLRRAMHPVRMFIDRFRSNSNGSSAQYRVRDDEDR